MQPAALHRGGGDRERDVHGAGRARGDAQGREHDEHWAVAQRRDGELHHRHHGGPRGGALRRRGGAVQIELCFDPQLESTRFQPLSLSSDFPVSKFWFSSNATCAATARARSRACTSSTRSSSTSCAAATAGKAVPPGCQIGLSPQLSPLLLSPLVSPLLLSPLLSPQLSPHCYMDYTGCHQLMF
jgi:hypothetical protein